MTPTRSLLIALTLCLPLAATAADTADAAKQRRAAPAAAASAAPVPTAAPAASHPAHNARARELQHQQQRGAKMGDCQKKAAEQNVGGLERRAAIARCMNAQ